MRYAQNLAEYNKAIEDGIIDENVFVIVLDEKVAKFRGQTFDWSGGISQATADARYIRKTVDEFDTDLTFAVADGIVGTDDEYYFLPEKAPSTALDSQILATKADVGNVDTSTLATKQELEEAEEVTASALNDLDERVRAINYTLYTVTATKEELKSEVDKINEKFTTIITDNEEVAAAAFNDLNEKIRNAVTKEELGLEVSKLDERTAYVREVSETTLSIEPNKYYKWTAAVSSLEITLTAPKDTKVLNNYMMEFTTSSTGCSLTLPTTIKWANGEVPTLDASITYQVSIINNLAVITKFL